jgi:hypothetical protein
MVWITESVPVRALRFTMIHADAAAEFGKTREEILMHKCDNTLFLIPWAQCSFV